MLRLSPCDRCGLWMKAFVPGASASGGGFTAYAEIGQRNCISSLFKGAAGLNPLFLGIRHDSLARPPVPASPVGAPQRGEITTLLRRQEAAFEMLPGCCVAPQMERRPPELIGIDGHGQGRVAQTVNQATFTLEGAVGRSPLTVQSLGHADLMQGAVGGAVIPPGLCLAEEGAVDPGSGPGFAQQGAAEREAESGAIPFAEWQHRLGEHLLEGALRGVGLTGLEQYPRSVGGHAAL